MKWNQIWVIYKAVNEIKKKKFVPVINLSELCNNELEQKLKLLWIYCIFVATGYDRSCLVTFSSYHSPRLSDPKAPAVTEKDWLRLLRSTASKTTCPGANLIG